MTLVDGGLELLEEDECWRLLRSAVVGRVGVSVGALPAIFPVNYTIDRDGVLFFTAPGTKLQAALDHAVVAFEVDAFDVATRSGWSVMLVGTAEEVPIDIAAGAKAPDPWVGGYHDHLVRIAPGFVSGRRIA